MMQNATVFTKGKIAKNLDLNDIRIKINSTFFHLDHAGKFYEPQRPPGCPMLS